MRRVEMPELLGSRSSKDSQEFVAIKAYTLLGEEATELRKRFHCKDSLCGAFSGNWCGLQGSLASPGRGGGLACCERLQAAKAI